MKPVRYSFSPLTCSHFVSAAFSLVDGGEGEGVLSTARDNERSTNSGHELTFIPMIEEEGKG